MYMKKHLYYYEVYLKAPANLNSWIIKNIQYHQNNTTQIISIQKTW